jgi:hypothetical protein
MKTYRGGGGGYISLPFLTSVAYGGEWSAWRLCCFNPWYPLDRNLEGPQSRSGRCGEEENLAPAGWAIPAPGETHVLKDIKGRNNLYA